MKTLDAGMLAHLQLDSTKLVACLRITRQDAISFYFTEHNKALLVNGNIYTPIAAFTRSAIENKEDLSVDNMDLVGVVDSASISDNDLRNGLFDAADAELFLVNWEDTTQSAIVLRTGRLGEAQVNESGTYFMELRGLTQQLSTKIVEVSTPACRAQFGDRRCKVPVDTPVWVTGVDYVAERLPVELSVAVTNEFRIPDSFLVSDYVHLTVRDGNEYQCTVAGRSNPVEPTWDTTPGNPTTQPWAGFTAWLTLETLALGAVRRATASPTDKLFVVTTAGDTGASEPTWNTTVDATTADGTVVWTTYPLPPEWVAEDAQTKESEVDALTPFTPTSRVFQVSAGQMTAVTGFYNFGGLTWLDGLNAGRTMEVRDWINASGAYVEDIPFPNLDFVQTGGDDTAVRDAGSWLVDGLTPGMRMTVGGSPAQNGTYLVKAVTEFTLTIEGDWPAQNLNTTGASLVGILRQITLFYPVAFTIADNDKFTIYPGCQRRMLQDCRDLFQNIINHRGEAYLPGSDKRFAFPNARN